MTTAFDFSALHSLLQQAPSAQVWQQLCTLVGGAKWGKAAAQWLPFAQDTLDRTWPDRLRSWPAAWRSKTVPASALARHLEVPGAQVKHMQQCIAALEADPPPLTSMAVTLGKDTEPLGTLLRAAPATLTRLWLTGNVPLDVVLANAPLARLYEFGILGTPLRDPDFGTLPTLHTLGVIPRVEFIEAMARVEMPSLRRLTHEHTDAMSPAVVEAVQRAPWGAQLEDMTGAGDA